MARDYEFKLNSLRLLKQALDSHLITWAQYNTKQEEFLNVVKFTPPEVSLDTTSLVAIKVQQMEDDLERGIYCFMIVIVSCLVRAILTIY